MIPDFSGLLWVAVAGLGAMAGMLVTFVLWLLGFDQWWIFAPPVLGGVGLWLNLMLNER